MTARLSKRHFWQWFLLHHKEYMELNKKSKKEFMYWKNELKAHLRAYFKFLHFSITVDKETDAGVLTISVIGKAQYFKYVDYLVSLAPAIPGWTIQALEVSRPIDFFWEEQPDHMRIDPHELWCEVPTNVREPFIMVYHRLYTEEKSWSYTQAAETALYNVLGERSFGLDIGPVIANNLSSAPEDAELIKLEELPFYLSCSESSFVIDASGEIRER